MGITLDFERLKINACSKLPLLVVAMEPLEWAAPAKARLTAGKRNMSL